MQTGPSGFDAVLAARANITVDTTVQAGGSVNATDPTGFGESVTIRRKLTGELPESATNIVGGVSTTLTLQGDGRMPGAPHPLIPNDLLNWLGAPVAVAAGYEGKTVPLFSGTVSEMGADEDARSITIEARDSGGKLTAPVRVQPYGSTAKRIAPGALTRHPTNTQGVIAAILHSNGIRVTPAPRSRCIISIPGVGGWLADVGTSLPRGEGAPADWLEAGRFGAAPKMSTEAIAGIADGALRPWAANNWFQIEFWYRHNGAANSPVLTASAGDGVFQFAIDSNDKLLLRSFRNPSLVTVLTSPALSIGWHHVCVQLGYDPSATMWIDGVAVGSSTSWASARPSAGSFGGVQFSPGRLQGVNVYHAGSNVLEAPSPSIMSFTSQADLSVGALDLDSIPNCDGRISSEVLQEIAEAELGMIGFSEAGRFFFKSRADLAANTTPVATWGLDLVESLGSSASIDTILTRATATVKKVVGIESGAGSLTPASIAIPVAIADEVWEIPQAQSSFLLTSDVPFLPNGTTVYPITTPGQAWNSTVGMALCTDAAGGTRYTGTSVSAWMTRLDQTTWRVNFQNNSGQSVYTAWPSEWGPPAFSEVPFDRDPGSPALWALGVTYPADSGNETVVNRLNATGLSRWGERVFAMGDSPWRQSAAQVGLFADAVLASTAMPRAQIEDVTVPADPRWQLGDPVKLFDWKGRLPPMFARITSIELTLSREVEGGMVGKYGVRQFYPAPSAPAIVTSPEAVSVVSGSPATFTAVANGSPVAAPQWQVSTDGGTTWADIPGATAAVYSDDL